MVRYKQDIFTIIGLAGYFHNYSSKLSQLKMAQTILGLRVLVVVVISSMGENSVSFQALQPAEFFPYANAIPMVYLSSYFRIIFNRPAVNTSIPSPPTNSSKLLEWLNPLLTTPLPPLTPLTDIFDNVAALWCSGALTPQQQADLRDVLTRYVNVSDLKLFINLTIGADEDIIFEAYDIAKYFYAQSPQSSAEGLAKEDKARLLVDLGLITDGYDQCPSFQDADEMASLLFRNLLPPRWDGEDKDEIVAAMLYLATSNLTSEDIAGIVDSFVKDSFIQNTPPFELVRFIATFLSTDVRRPLCSTLHQYGAIRCNNVTQRDLSRLCVELYHYAATSEYYGVKIYSRLIAASLDCGDETPPTSPEPTTSIPITNCGISDTITAGRSQRSTDLKITRHIIGGVNAGSCAVYPWVVRLDIDGESICGGALLDATHVLTAAHCVQNKNSIRATIGEYDVNVMSEFRQYAWVDMFNGLFIHPNFDYNGKKNDIAVLKLNASIDLQRTCAKPICLDPMFQVSDGQECQVAGWGLTKADDEFGSDILQTVSIPTYQGTVCHDIFPNVVLTDPTKQLCAGESLGNKDSCSGDSGGPLFCLDESINRWVAAGVVSYGNANCGAPNSPGVYVKVSAYYAWIQQKLSQ